MAKMIAVSKAEHEMLVAAYSQDGFTIAKLEAELAQAKEDIKNLILLVPTPDRCVYCKGFPPTVCSDCKMAAEWRGYQKGV